MTRDTPAIDRVLVAGATGKTGRRVLRHLADTDLTVRGMTRSPDKDTRLVRAGADEVVVGDLLEPADAARAVAGADAVLTCVGSTPVQVHTAEEFADGTGNENLVAAAVEEDVAALVVESSLGVGGDRGSWMARFFRAIIGPVVAAKTRAERAVRESDLRYTIFRPGVLLSYGPDGAQVADAGTGLWGAVTRDTVASLMAAAPFTPAAENRTLEVARNPLQRDWGLDLDWRSPAAPGTRR